MPESAVVDWIHAGHGVIAPAFASSSALIDRLRASNVWRATHRAADRRVDFIAHQARGIGARARRMSNLRIDRANTGGAAAITRC